MRPGFAVALLIAIVGFAATACDGGGTAGGGGSDGDTDGDGDTDVDADGDTDSDTDVDADGDTDSDTDVEPFGEIVIEQIYLPTFNLGEAILIVGPDGTSVLVDTANDSHAPNVIEAIERRTGERRIDWAIITHYHNDHIGGFDNLFAPAAANGNDPVELSKGLITRGMVDIATDTVGVEDFDEMCEMMAGGDLHDKRIDMCEGTQYACDGSEAGAPWEGSGCDGLLLGDLEDPSDDGEGRLSYISLGGGARLYLFQANGHVALDGEVIYANDEGLSIGHGATYPENARSLGGAVRWGDFTYVFNGDTPGENPDMEGFIADRAADLVVEEGGDVMHLSHHGLDTSTSQGWIDWLFPADGSSRNAAVGTTSMYYHSPAQGLLDRLAPRLAEGYIWTTALGIMPGSHARLKIADGAVEVLAETGGTGYRVSTIGAGGQSPPESYTSTGE